MNNTIFHSCYLIMSVCHRNVLLIFLIFITDKEFTYSVCINIMFPCVTAQGILVDLYHFITLDGRHFTFKGTCAYVLLQDTVDGNFSVAIDYASKSLVVSDQHESVEFFSDQTVSTTLQE